MPTVTINPDSDVSCSLQGSSPYHSQLSDSNDGTYLQTESKINPHWEVPDANHDQKVDNDDYTYIQRAVLGLEEWNPECDANGDGDASVADPTACAIFINEHPGYTYDYYHREPGDPQSVIIGLSNPSIPSGSVINSVKVHWRAKAIQYDGSNAPKAYAYLGLGGNYTNGTERTLSTSWTDYEDTITRPGGGVWSVDDFNSMVAGCTISEQSYLYRGHISKLYVVIDYTTPAGDQIYVII